MHSGSEHQESSHHDSSRRRTEPSQSRDIVSMVFSFFLAMTLLAVLVAGNVWANLIFDRGFLSLFDGDYYHYVLNYVNNRAYYYTMPTSYDPEVLEGVFTIDRIMEDVDGCVQASFNGNTYTPDESVQREQLTSLVMDLHYSEDVEMSGDDEAAISSYVDGIMKIYESGVKLPGIDAIASIRSRLRLPLVGVTVVLLFAILMFSRTILSLHHYVHRGLRYIAYATGGACLLSGVIPAVLLAPRTYRSLSVAPQFFYHFCMRAIERILFVFLAGASLYLLVTVGLVVFVSYKRKHLHVSPRTTTVYNETDWYIS